MNIPTKIVRVHSGGARFIHKKDAPRIWRSRLLEAGLLVRILGDPPSESPQYWIRALQGLISEYEAALEEHRSLRSRKALFGQDISGRVWLAVLALPAAVFSISSLITQVEQRAMTIAWFYGIFGVIALLVLLYILVLTARDRYAQRKRLDELEALIPTLGRDLAEGTTATLAWSFVARNGSSLVISTPHLSWLKECKNKIPPSATELHELVVSKIEELEAALEALVEDPPAVWSSRGLTPDLTLVVGGLNELDIERDLAWEAVLTSS